MISDANSTLLSFWVGVYLYQIKTAQPRLRVLLEIEEELGMKGQYRAIQGLKSAKHVIVTLLLFLVPFLLGPVIGFALSRLSLF